MKEYKKCFKCGYECVSTKDNQFCPKCRSDMFYPVEADMYTFDEIMQSGNSVE